MFHAFEGIENVRDLGGLKRADGARVREGLLFRTGRLTNATDGDIDRLRRLGISEIMDFRDASEVRRDPDREVPGAVNHHLPALPDLSKHFKPVDDPSYTAEEIHADFQRVYRYLALSTEAHEAYTRFFEILLASEGRPVLWHCTQGKDRTGVAALLLLTALGVDEETIVREYMTTNEFMQRHIDEFEASGAAQEQMAIAREVFYVFEENLRYYLHCLQVEYGTVMNFLELTLGVGPREIAALERYYLEA